MRPDARSTATRRPVSALTVDQQLRLRLRQQEILAELGTLALRGGQPDSILQEATRLVALGLETMFCKVLEYRPHEDQLLVIAGVGWRDGVVGHARIGADLASPAGYALKTGKPVISNSLDAEARFQTPALLIEHGIQRAINVIIRSNDAHFGVLEADSRHPGDFEPQDLAFMQAAANMLGLALDRGRTERALAASHDQTRDILESISDAFYAVDHDWRLTYFNRKAEDLWGRTRADLLGKVYWEEFPQAADGVIHEAQLRAARDQRVVTVEAMSPVLNRWVDVTIFPGEGGLSVYLRDISRRKQSEDALKRFAETLEQRVRERTRELAEANARLTEEIAERRKAEAALMQAQRLEAIGQLTGGIAHDFNNLLTAVIGNLELLRPVLTERRAIRQVESAMQAAQRGGELTRQLLAYARKQHVEPRAVDANAVVTRMRDLLGRSLGGLISIETSLAPGLWAARTDPVQLESIVLNLAINARDAMPEGGGVRIATRNVPRGDATLPAELERRDYVLILVEDEGTGMPPDVLAKAFEPFFTTKEIGKGSGLGLAQVHGVVQQFGGTARLRSAVGIGTVVEVYLPRSEEPAAAAAAEEHRPRNAPPPGGITVLVVDDQDDVRDVAVAFLEDAGYSVRAVGSGPEGLAALEGGAVCIALVDYGMAEMSGTEFVRQARRRFPGLPVIYLTGHAEPLDSEGVDPGDRVLTKPYAADDLLEAVQRTLDAGGKPGSAAGPG
jgi:PAS domain S-box-containing protein